MTVMDETSRKALALIAWFRRAGVKHVEFAYMNESPLKEERKWWAKGQLGPGEFVMAENHDGPIEAMEAMKAECIELAGFDAGAEG